MSACLSVINSSNEAISVYIDDDPFSFLLPGKKSICKTLPSGSICLKVSDSRDKIVFDMWLSIKPDTRHLFEISSENFSFKLIPHS